jgi:hypothetical protein
MKKKSLTRAPSGLESAAAGQRHHNNDRLQAQ